jgi:hypothetical protein
LPLISFARPVRVAVEGTIDCVDCGEARAAKP